MARGQLGLRRSIAFAWLSLGVALAQTQGSQHNSKVESRYIDPRACAECHQSIAASYARTAMSRSFGKVVSENGFSELKGGTFQHAASAQQFTLHSLDGRPYLRRNQIGFDGVVANVVDAPIDYWFGSGKHARSYISRTKSGELVELPITWYSEKGGYWAMSPAYDRPDHAGFSRKITYRCMSCHNGYPVTQSGEDVWEGGTRFLDRLPEGIDCQRCHGPGEAHVDAVRRGLSPDSVRSSIVNPARLSKDRQLETCMQCHLETTSLKLPATLLRHGRGVFSYRPGEPLENYILHFDRAPDAGSEDRFEFASAAYRLRKSKCYSSSGGALTCTTCHNPHEPSDTPIASRAYIEACLSCHRASLEKLTSSRRHPVSRECTSCHMPKRRPADAIHVSVTDHLIQKRSPVATGANVAEKHDANTPPYRGRVVPYYPSSPGSAENAQLYIALAQVKHEANLQEGLAQLEAAIARYRPDRSEFYFELAEGYRHAGRLDKAIAFYEIACSRAPEDWRHFYRMGTTLATAGHLERALRVLERAQIIAPKETAIQEAIANLLSRQGRLREAVEVLRRAVASDPESGVLHANLGARLLQLGEVKKAEEVWREAVRLRPESSTNQLNLANLLSSRGAFGEAQYHFKAAIRISPSFADAHFAYAVALQSNHKIKEAEAHFRESIIHSPNHFESHLKLGQILIERKAPSLARPHLLKASESPDARIQRTAKDLLN
jgi:tetratricopeptide (TPR) repeat protein